MSARSVVEVLLEGVELVERGVQHGRTTRHMVLAALVWPRPAIAERTALKDLELPSGVIDLGSLDWTDRILFKETVEGPFGIKVDVTDVVTDNQVADFLRVMASAAVQLAGAEVAGLATAPFVKGLVKVPFQHGSKLIASAGKKAARVIARGQVDIGLEEGEEGGDTGGRLVARGEEVVIEVPLCAPARIERVTRSTSGGATRSRRRTVLKKGEPNGKALLRLRRYT